MVYLSVWTSGEHTGWRAFSTEPSAQADQKMIGKWGQGIIIVENLRGSFNPGTSKMFKNPKE